MGIIVVNRINRDRNYVFFIKFLNGVKRIFRRILWIVEFVFEIIIKKVFIYLFGFFVIKMVVIVIVVVNVFDNKLRWIFNYWLYDIIIKKVCVFLFWYLEGKIRIGLDFI